MEHETRRREPSGDREAYPDPSGAVELETWLVKEERCLCAALSMSSLGEHQTADDDERAAHLFPSPSLVQVNGALTMARESPPYRHELLLQGGADASPARGSGGGGEVPGGPRDGEIGVGSGLVHRDALRLLRVKPRRGRCEEKEARRSAKGRETGHFLRAATPSEFQRPQA